MSEVQIPALKICKTCKQEKAIFEFSPNRFAADRRQYVCKSCSNAWIKSYRQRCPEKYSYEKIKLRNSTPERLARAEAYRRTDKVKKRNREYRRVWIQNPENRKLAYAIHEKWRKRPEVRAAQKLKRQNPEVKARHRENAKRYRNRPDVRLKLSHPKFRIRVNMRCRLRHFVKQVSHGKSMLKLIGLNSFAEFQAHLVSQFKPGMTWENYGRFGWHVDHKIPLSHFDLLDESQLLKAMHYTNLQPLWWYENLSKGNRIQS